MQIDTHQKKRAVTGTRADVGKTPTARLNGASTGPKMRDKGLLGASGPNASIASSLPAIRKRARHAVRNMPYATAAEDSFVSNVVGNGITAKWPTKELQDRWEKFRNNCDADGVDSFDGLTELVSRTMFTSGEALIRRRTRSAQFGGGNPLRIEVLEGDHLDDSLSKPGSKASIVMGVEFNPVGERQAYHVLRHHPGDSMAAGINTRSRVPADDIAHVYRRLRPKQIRGIPELSPILVRLYEIDEMQGSTLDKQKLAALIGWVIKRTERAASLHESSTISGDENTTEEYGEQLETIVSGGIHYLDEGEELDVPKIDGVGTAYDPWLKTELRACAKGAGLTYEQLTGDLTGVNYSSIRAGLIEFRRRIEQIQNNRIIFQFCHRVAEWFLESVALSGEVPGLASKWLSDKESLLPVWKPPRWDWVDPLKDVLADAMEVRTGLNTLKNKHGERCLDHDEVINQLAIEQAYNIVLDSNPAKTTKTGGQQDLFSAAGQTALQNGD